MEKKIPTETSSTTSLLSAKIHVRCAGCWLLADFGISYTSSKTMSMGKKGNKKIFTLLVRKTTRSKVCKSHSSVRQMTERNYCANTTFISIFFRFLFSKLLLTVSVCADCKVYTPFTVAGDTAKVLFVRLYFFPLNLLLFYRMPCSFCYIL